MKIWIRLVLSILASIVVTGSGLIYWATQEQRSIATDQARDFANNVNQMTLAGLTGMMITGTIAQRQVFLDQIKAMDQIEFLKVIRGDAVARQFGPGFEGEGVSGPGELSVLQSGKPDYAIVRGVGGEERLRVVIPAIAQTDYLGKNCVACHKVPVGTVLGAISMEISLAKSAQATRIFSRNAFLAGAAVCVPLALFIWLFISRMVSRPLARMTEGLNQIVDGNIEDSAGLPVVRVDEVGITTQAFNLVLTKVHELLRQQRLSRMVFDNSLEGITVTDTANRIIMVNSAFTATTGYAADEAIGQTPAFLKSGRQDKAFYVDFWQEIKEKDCWHGEIWNKRKDGIIYPQWLSVTTVRNRRGKIENYIAIFADITERKEHERLMTYQALHDPLTGLPNRRLFHEHLDHAVAQAKRNTELTPAIMFLDLDKFKNINDTLGHDAGDILLKEVAKRLRKCVREVDTVARLGGDEFTVLLPQITSEFDARVVAKKVLSVMLEPVNLGVESRVISTSIGISLYPRDGRDSETLIKNADAAMYTVKGSGRAGMCFYSETLLEIATGHEGG